MASKHVAVAGVMLGFGTLGVGTIMRLRDGNWNTTSVGMAASSGVIAAVSLLLAWAMWPDRDDRLQVINAWNRRHPQDVLWP
jgi:hypothetical protein